MVGSVSELLLFAPSSYMFKLIIGVYLISNYNLDLYISNYLPIVI